MPADEFRVCDFGKLLDLTAFQKPPLKLDTNTHTRLIDLNEVMSAASKPGAWLIMAPVQSVVSVVLSCLLVA